MRRIFTLLLPFSLGLAFSACSKKAEQPAAAEPAVPSVAPVAADAPPADDTPVSFQLSGNTGTATPDATAAEANIEPARWLLELRPFYPLSLRMQGIEGRVDIRVLINTEGRVDRAEVIGTTEPRFNDFAVACMRGSRFVPQRENGVPVPLIGDFSVAFLSEYGSGSMPRNSPLARLALHDGTYYTTGPDGRLIPAESKEPITLLAVEPIVPESLRGGKAFKATAKITISEEGQVTKVDVSDATSDEFKRAVEEVLPFWQFVPRLKNGKPVQVTVTLPIVGPQKAK